MLRILPMESLAEGLYDDDTAMYRSVRTPLQINMILPYVESYHTFDRVLLQVHLTTHH